jgi:hypothetical protein
MKKPTSFIGEHTVELTIVPILKDILNKDFDYVTPIFPWMTREGGSISKYLHENEEFKIIGLYPRRPKITISDDENIYLKINEQIILGSQCGLELGIPIIAGYPIVKNFWELGKNPNCLWIKLDFELNENIEFQIKLDKTSDLDTKLSKKVFQKDNEILDYISMHAKMFEINDALEAFRRIKMESINLDFYSSFAFMGGYKPIYFLLK